MEAGARFDAGSGLVLRASWTHQRPRDAGTGARLANRPDDFGTLGAEWTRGAWTLAADVYHQGAVDDLGAVGPDQDLRNSAGRRTVVVGAGHSAANTLLSLAELAREVPGTSVVWAIRATSPARTYGGGAADALPARGTIGSRLREHVDAGSVELVTGFAVRSIAMADGRVVLSDGEWVAHGDPMEAAVDALARRLDVGGDRPPQERFPFDPRRRMMSVVADGSVLVKGAPDAVLLRCGPVPAAAAEAVHDLGTRGLRTLAVARRRLTGAPPESEED